MTKTLRRKKSNYSSARAAWQDIDRRTAYTHHQVIEADHSRTHYRWVVPDKG
jgi:hypothetical protein